MIINNIIRNKQLIFSRFITFGILTLFLLISVYSFSQNTNDENNFQQCRACHTIGSGKLVGPDLKGVTDRRDEAWLISFIQNSQKLIQSGNEQAVKIFNENNRIPMPPHNLTDDQVRGIIKYIANGGKLGADQAKVAPNEDTEVKIAEDTAHLIVETKRDEQENMRWVLFVMVILLLVSIVDLAKTKILKAKWIHYIVIITSLFIISEIIFVEATSLGRQQYYQPDQPVWFSHKVHAGQNQIDCKYCHFTVEKSMHAGIPPVSVCMNCHSQVKKGTRTGTKEISKIYDAIKNNEPIAWVKVYNLPDHVYFNHAQHVNVGQIDCIRCHGDVAKMDQIIEVPELSMGWCISCHRTEKVHFESNKFYDQYTELHKKLKDGEMPGVTVQNIGGDECAKCHY